MIDAPQITRTAARLTALIRLTVPRSEIRNVMGPGLSEVLAAVAAQGIPPAGPGPLGMLRRRSGIESRPGQLADGAEPAADRLTRPKPFGRRRRE